MKAILSRMGEEESPIFILRDHTASDPRLTVEEVGYGWAPRGQRRVLYRSVYILQFIIEGRGIFNGIPFEAGDVLFVAPNEPEIRVTAPNESYRCAWIMFRGEEASTLLSRIGLPTSSTVFPFIKCKKAAELLERCAQEPIDEDDLQYALLSLLFKIFSFLPCRQDAVKEKSSAVERARFFIKNNYHRDLRIAEVAAFVGLSQNHLCKLFKHELGMSIRDFLLHYRLDRAASLLQESTLSVHEIAEAVGYHDSKHFSQLFRVHTGCKPSVYRDNG